MEEYLFQIACTLNDAFNRNPWITLVNENFECKSIKVSYTQLPSFFAGYESDQPSFIAIAHLNLNGKRETKSLFAKSVAETTVWAAELYNSLKSSELQNRTDTEKRPEIICLCGSTRFYDAFQKANYELTMQGKIVLTVGFYPHSSELAHGQNIGCDDEQKAMLDELHKRKIDLCDRVLVLNVGGYIGSSTRSEIEYAKALNKPIIYLEPA